MWRRTSPSIAWHIKRRAAVGIDLIHTRVACLTGWLIEQLVGLRHSNGAAVVCLYGPPNTQMRGGTIQLNFFDPAGKMFDSYAVEAMANDQRISLRAGCHCNPGARELALGFTEDELITCFRDADHMTYEQFTHVIDGKTTGALRASIGLVTTFADVYTYLQFARTFVDRSRSSAN
jgi:molybdenum cofactor sulfurtransferase